MKQWYALYVSLYSKQILFVMPKNEIITWSEIDYY